MWNPVIGFDFSRPATRLCSTKNQNYRQGCQYDGNI